MVDIIKVEGIALQNVHDSRLCAGRPCVVHNCVQHSFSHWPLVWRNDRGMFERTCPHGIGHPEPNQLVFWRESEMEYEAVHGCDGCCTLTDEDRKNLMIDNK